MDFLLTAPAQALKRVHQLINLRVRTLNARTKVRSSRSGPLTLRFLTGLVHALLKSDVNAEAWSI
ncbi:hypothetical protein F5J09_01965 [Lacticaseibacillus paracasei]|nr:hypothetical protein F5J09_01965 [Lacticaseibacillus paracasei]